MHQECGPPPCPTPPFPFFPHPPTPSICLPNQSHGPPHPLQDYIYIHQEHNDWVSQVAWVPEIGLVSSSVDSTIRIYDFVREKVG